MASGLSNRDIATRLFISKRTVDAHVGSIFAKLEISSRVSPRCGSGPRSRRARRRADGPRFLLLSSVSNQRRQFMPL